MRLILGFVRIFLVHRLDFKQSEKALFFLGRTNLAGHQIAGLQIEPPDLRRGNVNILRTRQIIETLRTQKSEAVGQHFQNAFGEHDAVALGVALQNLEDNFVFF